MRKHLFKFTPLGRADQEVKEYLKEKLDEEDFQRYEEALGHYRYMKLGQLVLKTLLYAGIVASVAATFGLDEAFLLQKIASYIGLSVIFVTYGIVSYVTMIRRESYHVQREILISKAGG